MVENQALLTSQNLHLQETKFIVTFTRIMRPIIEWVVNNVCLLQAQSSSLKSQSPDNEIELITKKQIRTAELATLSEEERSYNTTSAGVDCKPKINALQVAIYKAEYKSYELQKLISWSHS